MSVVRRFSRLLYQSNNLKQAVGILFVTVLISNILGLVRNMVISNRIGLTYGSIGPLDNYYAAFVIPDLLYSIVIVGALSSAVLPLLTKLDAEGKEKEFWQTFNLLLSTGFTAIMFGLAILYFLLPLLIPGLFPGFSDAETQLTTQLAQVMLLSPLFFTISQLSTAALQAKKMFLAPALAPLVYNLAIISGALLIPQLGLSILVFAVVLGAVSHFLIQMPALIKSGWRFIFQLNLANREVRDVIRLMIPRAVALTGSQLLLVAFYHLASSFRSGSIAIYRLTDDLQTAPVLLLANTLAMAVLPDFVRRISKQDRQEFAELVGKALRLIIFIFLPVSTFLLIFKDPIIDIYISVGHSISRSEVELASQTFALFVWSLVFQGAILLLVRAYFARQDTLRPTVYSLTSLGFSYALALIFSKTTGLGVTGLALSYSLGALLNAILLWANLKLPASLLWRDSSGRFNLPVIVLGTVVTATVLVVFRALAPLIDDLFIVSRSGSNLLEIVIGLILASGFYYAWGRAFKLEQWRILHPIRKISMPK